jgi:dihydrofolate reductase
MMLSAIVATSDNNVIGCDGQIPWHIPGEQARVKEITMGHPLVMGRKTHDSIGRTLPGRLNVVISCTPGYKPADDSVVAPSLADALAMDEVAAADEVFIFGGQGVFEEAMPLLQRIYLTRVHVDVPGDAFFKYTPSDWQEVSTEGHPSSGEVPAHDYILLERKH